MADPLTLSIDAAVREAREARGLTMTELAERSGVSRAMIAKIEHGEAQPTAVLLARLSEAFGLTLSELVARAEDDGRVVSRAAEQPVWTDPATGYTRRSLSPPAGGPLELAELELPPGARVAYPAGGYLVVHQQLWLLAGSLRVHEEQLLHELAAGDCLQLSRPGARTYANVADRPCRYLVAFCRR